MKRIIGAITVLTVVTVAQERPAAKPAIQIVTVSGQGGTNLLDGTTPAPPLVEIQDASGKRLAGAQVTFQSPEVGPRAIFSGGKHTMSVRSNKEGRATPGKMAVADAGSFEITVEAVFRGQRAAISLKQTNYPTLSDAQSASVRPTGTNLIAGRNSLRIEILEGDDAVNIIDKATAVKPIIRVVDKNNLPVAGVAVTMAIVATRGGGRSEFTKRQVRIEVTTDAAGRAEVPNVRPLTKGPYRIDVRADSSGEVASRSITQTNYGSEWAAVRVGKVPGASTGDAAKATAADHSSLTVRPVGAKGNATVTEDPQEAPAIEVTDVEGNPVGNAHVVFLLSGPARFESGARYMTTLTGVDGRAAAATILSNGKRPVSVRTFASAHGYSGSATISRTAPLQGSKTSSQRSSKPSKTSTAPAHPKTTAIVGLMAAGAGIAGVAAAKQPSRGTKDCRALCTRAQAAFQSAISNGACRANGNLFLPARSAANEYSSCVGEPPIPDHEWAAVELDLCLGDPVSRAFSCQP